jgi:hypothetical protein
VETLPSSKPLKKAVAGECCYHLAAIWAKVQVPADLLARHLVELSFGERLQNLGCRVGPTNAGCHRKVLPSGVFL